MTANFKRQKLISIVIAEDDEEDRMLILDAFKENCISNRVDFVENGEELLDFLKNKGKYENKGNFPKPGLIILDLNMPRKDGKQALREIKNDNALKKIPVVILTTSKDEEDVAITYELGVNSFITKPVTFAGLLDIVKALNNYWFEIVELP